MYLQYVRDDSENELVEELEILPMQNERYSQLQCGGIAWTDVVLDWADKQHW